MNVYDQAHGLAQAIKASEEYKQYDMVRQQVKANAEIDAMIKDFQAKQFEMQAKQMTGQQMTQEDVESIQQLYGIMLKDPLSAHYVEAEMRFSLMMKDVYEILGEATGMGDILG
ncbi:MAG: hypothetical protein DBY08_02300 [Clostridiales bacterium]|nr:YlbF family regulator [Bacillota bacterium]MEE0517593.1 YlbF family regulator [Anaerovoracaceae bacterium]PWL94686.1 MAG: hypothetical protein DBY08_02300 [Clostridiales bacterium]